MRCRPVPACPAVLAGAVSKGGRETSAAIAYYGQRPQPTKSYDFKAYGDDAVRKALNEAFGFKCAYCESSYGATQPVDVEHYRPKAAVLAASGRMLKPGYYWLAATWDNLLPSCIDCNRARAQEIDAAAKATTGKANRFPLADERRRIRRPGSVDREDPLLLHPYYDEPEAHLEFGLEGVVRATADLDAPTGESRKGRATRDVLGLNRTRLVHARHDYQLRVEVQLERVADAEQDIVEHPAEERYERRLRRELTQLAKLQAADAPYTMLTGQIIQRYRQNRLVVDAENRAR
jgi:uncharacterized protein (TIGR02646 family)